MKIGVFVPIGNNGWLISTHAPQYMPTFELNKAIVQKAEHYHFDFALSMIKLRGFGGKTEFWDHNLESFTLMAGLAAVTSKIQIYATAATLTLPPAIVARGSATAEGLNGQTSMLFSWQNGMQGLLNTTLFSNTPGGAVVAGRQATLTIDGQFYAPGGFTLAASQGGQVLRWEEPRNRYDQLFWQAEHFAWCIGQGLQDSPLRPLSRVLQNLQVMDEVRRQVGAVFNEER